MTSEIDLSNNVVRKIKAFVKKEFTQPPKDFFLDIIESYEQILTDKKIDLEKVIKPKEYRGIKNSTKDRIETFRKKNSKTLMEDSNILSQEYTDKLVHLLQLYKRSLSTPNKAENTRDYTYKDADEDPLDEDLIIPREDTNLSSVKLNFFYNKDVVYGFNDKIPLEPLDRTSSTLQTLRIKINGVMEHDIIPIKKRVICTEKTEGIECGNVVHFSDVHLNSIVRCTDSGALGKGHVIKKLEKTLVEESMIWYVYEGSDLLSEESSEIIICSLTKLNQNVLTVNAVFVNDDTTNYVLVLSYKEEKIKPLDKEILIKNPESKNFLEDIYQSVQEYLNKYHNIVLTNQNKIIGLVLIFIILNNIFYKKRINSLIVGSSGSGKSIWAEFLIPLFTLNYKVILGTDITRNKFIGGRSNLMTTTVNSLFSPGYIATQDIVFAEECTNSLKDFQDTRINQKNNIFHLIKACSGREIDIAIQGGQKVYPKASTILVGNLEQLDFTQEYKTLVASKYRKLKEGGSRDYKEKWPLFKPIGYYINVLKNIKLAEAHSIVRQTYKSISGNHFITRLPPAEMARYSFFIALEEGLNEKKSRRILKNNDVLNNPKREYFIKELKEIFFEGDKVKECPYEIKKQINDFYNEEFYESRNNLKNIFGPNNGINAHIENNIIMIMEQLVWMNKVYLGKEDDKNLNEEDKEFIKYFLSFNFNTLGQKEASMEEKPFINDFEDLEGESLNIDLEAKEEYWEKVNEKKKKDDEELKKMLDDDDAENIL